MTMRENILDIHAGTVAYKEHLAVCPKHGTRELGLQMIGVFQSGKQMRFHVDKVAAIVDHLFYERGNKLGDWPTCIDAALHISLQGVMGRTKVAMPAALLENGAADKPDVGDRLRALIIACEAYSCPPEYEAVVGIDQQEEGDERLRDDFNNNPASQVTETMMTFVVEDDLCGGVEWAGVMHDYHKADGGGIEWDDPKVIISDADGMEPDNVAHTIRTNPQLRATIPYFNMEVQA